MSASLQLDNFASANIEETSRLAVDVNTSTTAFTVENAAGFLVDRIMVFGQLGGETTEKRRVTNITNNTLTIQSAFLTAHSKLEPVTQLFGDQIQVYRAPNVNGSVPADGAFVALGTPVDIQVDQLQTPFTDNTGGSGYWYKIAYRHSVSGAETDLSLSIAVRGGSYGNYVSIAEIRKFAGLDGNSYISDAEIATARMQAQSEINGALSLRYAIPFEEPLPPVIALLTKELAAGILMARDFGMSGDDTSKDAGRRLSDVRKRIKELATGEVAIMDQYSAPIASRSVLSYWPNDTTADLSEDSAGGGRMFRISKRF